MPNEVRFLFGIATASDRRLDSGTTQMTKNAKCVGTCLVSIYEALYIGIFYNRRADRSVC